MPESIESSWFVSHRAKMSGELDSRKDSQSTKFEQRPWIFMKLRDCQLITFVMLNRFCSLSRTPPLPPPTSPNLPVLNTTISKWIEYQPKSNEKHAFFRFIVFQVLKICTIKFFKTEPPDLLFLVFISFYTNRYYFSQIFRTSFSIIWKKDFCHKFYFLTDSLKPPTPKWPKSAKCDESFLAMLPKLQRVKQFKINWLTCF